MLHTVEKSLYNSCARLKADNLSVITSILCSQLSSGCDGGGLLFSVIGALLGACFFKQCGMSYLT